MRSFHAGTRISYKKEFENSDACLEFMMDMFRKLNDDGYVYVKDVCPDKVANDAEWVWTAMNLVHLYRGGTAFEIMNKPVLKGALKPITDLHFANDYTLMVLSQYDFIQTIDDLMRFLKERTLHDLYGIGEKTIEDVRAALDDWYLEHGV